VRIYLPLVLTIFAVSQLTAQSVDSDAQINTTGAGSVTFTPDLVVMQVAVETLSDKVGDASDENARKIESVMRALDDFAVSEEDRSTASYDVSPEYGRERDGRRVVTGYLVRNLIQVVVRDTDNVGRVIDAVIEAGANRITRVSFTSSTLEELQRRAIAEAVADARSLAELIAESAGGSLGDLVEIRFQRVLPVSTSDYAVSEIRAGPETPIAIGQHVVRAVVQTRWQYKKN
jgi:uncharacterized protein YggE